MIEPLALKVVAFNKQAERTTKVQNKETIREHSNERGNISIDNQEVLRDAINRSSSVSGVDRLQCHQRR